MSGCSETEFSGKRALVTGGTKRDGRSHRPTPRKLWSPTGTRHPAGLVGPDETPGSARDFGVWRAKEMVDRGRIELPIPGFSVVRAWRVNRTESSAIVVHSGA
jgi:hypothetical protein